jgi:7-carboxy-7-deazaguanine synthase
MRYPVNEIFTTVQGEGTFTGTPATFVRLQGCPVGCAWCDTKHTWKLREDDEVNLAELDAKQDDSPKYALCSPADILSRVRAEHVVITGGEPCLYDLWELTAALVDTDHRVQIETSGTHVISAHPMTFVTVSPKVNMPGGFKVLDSSLRRANELKMPVGRQRDITMLQELLKREAVSADAPVFLAPLSQSPKATQLCLEHVIANNWRLSLQTHKFIGAR